MAIISAVPKGEPPRRPAPAPQPVQSDPMRGTIEAIDRLVKVVESQQAKVEPVAPALSQFPVDARPVRLEADVVRDKAGKMQRVIITPVY